MAQDENAKTTGASVTPPVNPWAVEPGKDKGKPVVKVLFWHRLAQGIPADDAITLAAWLVAAASKEIQGADERFDVRFEEAFARLSATPGPSS